MNNWREIYQEQVVFLLNSGLYDLVDEICIGVLGSDALPILPPMFKMLFQHSDVTLAEIPTLESLRERAMVEDFNVLYFHTKGVSHPDTDYDFMRKWRKYMEGYCIGKWKECITHLKRFDTVGCEYHAAPFKHFSGNFWWSKASYLRTLPRLKDVPLHGFAESRMKAEIWVGTNPRVKIKCLSTVNDRSFPLETGE